MKEYLEHSHPEFYEREYAKMPMFDSQDGMGVVWEDGGEELTSMLSYREKKRKVVLKITSWRGISSNAVHYYGTLRIEDLYFGKKGSKRRKNSSAQPEITLGAKINVRRPLPQEEIDKDPRRYEYYDAGDYITGFMSKKDLIEVAEKIFKEKFVGDWKFVIE